MTNRLAGLSAATLRVLGLKADASEEETVEAPAETEITDEAPDDEEAESEAAPASEPEPEADETAVAAAEAALGEAAAQATAAANARWAAVLRHEAAAGRTTQAIALLEATDLAPDAIAARLSTFPKEDASSFMQRMSEVQDPSITGGQEVEPRTQDAQAGWSKAVGSLPHAKRK